MSAQDRYRQIIESLVNGEKDEASSLLHEAFVEKARDIWSDLVEQDEIVEDEIAEEDLEEAIGDEEAGDFLDDIEEDEDEIESEEAFGEGEDEEDEGELEMDDAELELAIDGDDAEGDEDAPDAEEAMQNVEDALADLKAAFADIMGDEDEGEEMDMDDMDEEIAFESNEEEVDESEEETLEEEANLSAVSVSHPDNTDGKAGPVGPGIKDPFASVDGEKSGTDMVSKGGSEKGGKAPAPKKMEATNPQDVKDLKPAPKAKG